MLTNVYFFNSTCPNHRLNLMLSMSAITTSTGFFYILCAFKRMFLNIFLTSYRVSITPSILVTNINNLSYSGASLVAHIVQNLPAMQKTWVCSLGQEDPPEKAMAIHSSTLAWKIPWTEEPGYSPWGRKELDMTE